MTATYTVNRDQVINGSLRLLGVVGAGDNPTPADYQNCAEALNLYIKQLQTKGLPLWKVEDLQVPMVTGQSTYTLGPTGNVVTDRPLRVVMAFIRSQTGNDTTLQVISRQEYMQQGYKPSPGVPNQCYYDPQLNNGVLYVYNTPADNTYTIHLQVQLPISDITNPNSVPEFPNEWYNLLKFGLADQVSLEYGVSAGIRQELAMRAKMMLEEMIDWSQEEASTNFMPETRFRM
jgi:hypothetical protein